MGSIVANEGFLLLKVMKNNKPTPANKIGSVNFLINGGFQLQYINIKPSKLQDFFYEVQFFFNKW
jgi:hypothetical protein